MTYDSSTSWSADHLRISFFSKSMWASPLNDVFVDAFSVNAESVTSRPISAEASAVGSWEGVKLEIRSTFNRIDFIVQALPGENSPITLIEDIQNLLPKFVAIAAKWAASQSQGIIRIAIGCGAFFPASGLVDSYEKVSELVRVINVDVNRFRDFRFQVNLPTNSAILPSLTINRISNWASVILRSGLIEAENSRIFDEKFYCTCGLDVNTDAERTENIPFDAIEKLSNELCSINLNILTHGIE